MPSVSEDALILAFGTGLFVLGLIGLTAFLSIARQGRAWKKHRSDSKLHPPNGLAQALPKYLTPDPHPTTAKLRPRPQSRAAAVQQRPQQPPQLAAQISSEPSFIQITPPDGPSRDEQNVRRLIEYLRRAETKNANTG